MLDQVALQHQCFQVCFAKQNLKIVDVGNHGRHLGGVRRIPEIAPDAVLQVHRFPHVNHGTVAAFHQVATR